MYSSIEFGKKQQVKLPNCIPVFLSEMKNAEIPMNGPDSCDCGRAGFHGLASTGHV